MLDSILTPDQAKAARQAVGISQGLAASLSDVSRTYLSEFENGRRILEDDVLERLRALYEEHGYVFDDEASEIDAQVSTDVSPGLFLNSCRFVDGFAIPAAVDEHEADAAMTEFAANSVRIKQLCDAPVEMGFFGWLDDESASERAREALMLMARNYLLISSLQGRAPHMPEPNDEPNTVGEIVAGELAEVLPRFASPEVDTGAAVAA